jgi:hypothetical protein
VNETGFVAFWAARLDDDERFVRVMTEAGQRRAGDATPRDMADAAALAMNVLSDPAARAEFLRWPENGLLPPGAPERTLADIAADRELLELHDEEDDPGELRHGHWEGHGSNERWIRDEPNECPACREEVPCRTARIRAARYAGHPEYKPEWKP